MKLLNSTLFIIIIFSSEVFSQQSLKISKNGDTIIRFRTDTLKPSLRLGEVYVANENTITLFSSHMVKDIAQPGSVNHRFYLQYINKANDLKPNVMAKLSDRVLKDPTILKWTKLKNPEDLKKCQLRTLPVYYLTDNVVNYDNSMNFTSFYNLDTATVYYKLTLGDRVVAITTYQNGFSRFKNFNTADSLSYYQIVAMRKEPIAFINHIHDKESVLNSPYDCFGYINKGQIIFVLCKQYDQSIRTSTGIEVKRTHYKDIKLQSAESYYLGSDSTFSTLPKIINSRTKYLKFKDDLKKKQ